MYKVPMPGIGRIMNKLVVQPQLVGIFEHRRKMITQELGWVRAVHEQVAVTRVG